jgi:large subunit ribosomal protein L21
MFAVIKTGSKQYKVTDGATITVEKLDADKGATIDFTEVLMVGDQVGTPTVAGATVQGVVVDHIKDDKVMIFKKKRRQNYRRLNGHRQPLSLVKITKVS